MSEENKNDSKNPLYEVAQFIVDKRNGFYLVFVIAVLFAIASISKVSVNEDLTSYLPEYTETRIGLDLMEEQFITYGTAEVMVENISYETAEALLAEMEEVPGVASVAFNDEDDDEERFLSASALYSVSFDEVEDSPVSIAAMAEIRERLADYDVYVNTEVGRDDSKQLGEEMKVITIIVGIVILGILTLTSKSYMEVAVFIIVFGVSVILNKGTNFIFGEISFITNAIAVVLQLALAIDYAIIFCHRYMEERAHLDSREAAIESLSKAIIEISASSLTTISGLAALMLMQFRIGMDMGVVLIKGIICSLLTVFLLMPGLLMLFSKGIEKTRHKEYIPNIEPWGRFILKLRHVMPVIFLLVLVAGYYFSGKCAYVFSINSVDTGNPSVERIALDKIRETFGEKNVLAILVPSGDYGKEKHLLDQLEDLPVVDKAIGLANIKISPGDSDTEYFLTERMTSRQFAETAGLELEEARMLYDIYGLRKEEYGAIVNKEDYSVALIDIFIFLCEQIQEGLITIDDAEQRQDIDDAYDTLTKADQQLRSEDWSRLLLTTNMPEEAPESFEMVETIRAIANKIYGDEVIIVGNTVNDKDLSESFSVDNIKISILTILFVMFVLLFTFKSAGLPVLLVVTIQGSIWINFSFPYLMHSNMYFIAYLIVSSIQMGATIDYAIVATSRYQELKKQMDKKTAAAMALNQGFATVLTSGSIMTVAGFAIYFITTNPTIGSIGLALGRGTLISILLVLTVLPQLLVIGDVIIERTAFTLKKDLAQTVQSENIRLEGHVKGYFSGYIDAEIKGCLNGSLEAVIKAGELRIESSNGEEEANGSKTEQLQLV